MKLIGLSIFLGLMGVFLASLLGIDAYDGNRDIVIAMWMIGFFSPIIYVLDKVYEEMKKKKPN